MPFISFVFVLLMDFLCSFLFFFVFLFLEGLYLIVSSISFVSVVSFVSFQIFVILFVVQRQYPLSHGASSVSFTSSSFSSASSTATASSTTATTSFSTSRWMLVGQEGGSVVRCQLSRMLGGSLLTQVNCPYSFECIVFHVDNKSLL